MKKFHQKKLFIFDLDGVIFDSKSNMEVAWNETSNRFNLNTPFSLYFKKIGMPFSDILKSLGLINDDRIYRYFQRISLKKISLIKPYKDAINHLIKKEETLMVIEEARPAPMLPETEEELDPAQVAARERARAVEERVLAMNPNFVFE